MKGSSLLCFLCKSSAVQHLWFHVIISLFTTGRKLWNNGATLIWSKIYFDNRKSSLPTKVVDWYGYYCVGSFWYPWILDSTEQLFIYLDWIDTVHCIFFLMLINNFCYDISLFCVWWTTENKDLILSAYLDSTCETCGAVLQNALVELLHTRNQLFLHSSDPSL